MRSLVLALVAVLTATLPLFAPSRPAQAAPAATPLAQGAEWMPTEDEVRASVTGSEPPRPRAVRRGVPAGLESIVLRCLAKAPEARYPTAGALADALARWLRRRAMLRGTLRLCIAAVALLAVVASAVLVLRPPDPEVRHAARSRAAMTAPGKPSQFFAGSEVA